MTRSKIPVIMLSRLTMPPLPAGRNQPQHELTYGMEYEPLPSESRLSRFRVRWKRAQRDRAARRNQA